MSALVQSIVGSGSSRRLVAPVEEVPADEAAAAAAADGEAGAEGGANAAVAAASVAPASPRPTLAYGITAC